jgi:polar amino acid transport system substrate-binding protein
MNKVAEMLGIEFQYTNGLAWGELLQRFREHEIDVMSAIYISESRKQYALFTQPYFKNPPAIITSKEEKRIRKLADLKGRRVALPEDFALFETLPKEVPGIIMVKEVDGKPVESTLDALKAVVTGDADAVVESAATLTHQIEQNGLPNLKISGFPDFEHGDVKDFDLYAAVRNDWPIFHRILVNALEHINQEDRLELQKKWFGVTSLAGNKHLPLTFQEQNYLSRKSVIRYCVDPDWMPYEALDDNRMHIGMTAELIRRVEERMGVPFRLVPTNSWQKSLEHIRSGRCDLLPAAAATVKRQAYLEFSKPVFEVPLVIAIDRDNAFVEDITTLEDRKIAVARGYAHVDLIREAYPKLTLIEVDNLDEGITLVQRGETFAVVDTVATIRYALAKKQIENLKIGGKLDVQLKLSFASRRDAGPELISIMTKALDSFPDAELDELRNRWSKVEIKNVINTRLLWQIALVSLVIIGIMLAWNRKLARITRELNEANASLERLSRLDGLTCLLNRRTFMSELHDEQARARRTRARVSVLLIDADQFKKINDTFGHATGDNVLIEIAQRIKDISREVDIECRFGGEEFAIALPETDTEGARHYAERLRLNIADIQLSREQVSIPVTVSIGVATMQDDETIEALLHRADAAMYTAKKNGRNRVEVA